MRENGLVAPLPFLVQRFKETLLVTQEFFKLCRVSVAALFKKPRYFRETIFQMDAIGFGSLPIIMLTGVFTGMVFALQLSTLLSRFGATMYVGMAVSMSMVKELGPVLSSLMVAGRVGSGIAAEIGSMVDTEQLDAMKVEGSDPIKKLVVPRMVACMLILPLLTTITNAIGVTGGFFIAVTQFGIDPTFYWTSVFNTLKYSDVLVGLLKPAFFGFIIAMVGSFMGLTTHGGTVGVGKSTTESVVYSSILILVSDFFITKFFITVL